MSATSADVSPAGYVGGSPQRADGSLPAPAQPAVVRRHDDGARTAAERAFADAERQIGLLQQKFQQSIGRTKIDLAAGLDPREAQKRIASAFEAMNQGIIHGRERLRAAGSLTPEIEQLLAKNIVKVPKVDPDITQIQRTFADVTRQVGRLEDRLQTEVARTKLDIAGGLDARAGEKRIAAAYENMNRGIVHGRERLARANLLTPEIEQFHSSSLVKVPKVARMSGTIVIEVTSPVPRRGFPPSPGCLRDPRAGWPPGRR